MNITVPQLVRLQTADPVVWAPLLTAATDGMTNPWAFLANVLHESCRLHTLRESLNYSSAGLLRQWPMHFSARAAALYGRTATHSANQWMIANTAYANRMGNGPVASGDGWKFRGAGCLQTTGRTNFARLADTMGWERPLENLPDYVATPAGAAESAADFWWDSGCDDLANPTDIRQRINGGMTGLAEVVALQAEIHRVLNSQEST